MKKGRYGHMCFIGSLGWAKTFTLTLAFMFLAGVPALLHAAVPVPTVAVSILPQTEFVTKIAGSRVRVLSLVGPGASPHNYEPSPRQMADLSKASLWLSIGVEFENALLPKIRALYPGLKVVNSAQGVNFRTMETEQGHDEAEGHEDGGRDPHVWLGFDAVKIQLATTLQALSALLPAEKAFFEANYKAYLAQIDDVYATLTRDLASMKGGMVLVYHPSFGYFLDAFGIRQEAVELGGKEPTQKNLALLITRAKKEGARVVFVQKQFSTAAARTVASAIGGVVVEIDPLAPAWLENAKAIGRALVQASGR